MTRNRTPLVVYKKTDVDAKNKYIYFFIFSNLVKLISFYIWRNRYSSNMEDLKNSRLFFSFHCRSRANSNNDFRARPSQYHVGKTSCYPAEFFKGWPKRAYLCSSVFFFLKKNDHRLFYKYYDFFQENIVDNMLLTLKIWLVIIYNIFQYFFIIKKIKI